MNFESNISGHENGNVFSLTDFEFLFLLGALSEGLRDGLLVFGARV